MKLIIFIVALFIVAGPLLAQDYHETQVQAFLKEQKYPDAAEAMVEVLSVHDECWRANNWCDALRKAKCYGEAERVALAAILAAPDRTDQLYLCQTQRVRAFLAMNKPQEALAAAKGLYNVCPLNKTADALRLLGRALKAAHPDDPGIEQRLLLQQMAAATTQPVAEASPSLLADIKVDPAAYKDALDTQETLDYEGLAGLGNLLLLADKPAEAHERFMAASGAHGREQEANENLARCMKAEDGGVAAANAWVMSIRAR